MADDKKTLDHARCKEIGHSCAGYNLRRATRAITRLYDDFLRPSGLRSTQYAVLVAVKMRGPVALTKLADMTVTDRTTLTRNLTILEKKGFIQIEPGNDRRERQVTLTGLGQEAMMAAIPLWEMAQAHIQKGLGEDRLGRFIKDLSEIVSLARTT
jgi:DNA-binding MarR family transcriptional regulator